MTLGNPTTAKPALLLSIAGGDALAPVLAGLAFRMTAALRPGESVESWTIECGEDSASLDWTDGEDCAWVDLVAGEDTWSTAAGARNVVALVTNLGTTRRQLFVRNLPASGSLLVGNQECQAGTATLYANVGDANPWAHIVTPGINILPNFSDELFLGQVYDGNAYANTRRNYGGAATAEVLVDGAVAIAERAIEEVQGLWWEPPSFGLHDIDVVLRASAGSAYAVTISGHIRVRQIPAPVELSGSVTLSITYTPSDTGRDDGFLLVRPGGGHQDVRIPITALATSGLASPLYINPPALTWLDVDLDEEEAQTFRLTNQGGADVVLVHTGFAVGENFRFEAIETGRTLHPGDTLDITVLFAPDAVGTEVDQVVLETDAGTQVVPLVGYSTEAAAVTSDPASIDFGTVPVGGSKTVEVTLTNVGAGPFVVNGETVEVDAGEAGEFEVS